LLPPIPNKQEVILLKAIDDEYTLHPFYGIRTLKCTGYLEQLSGGGLIVQTVEI